MAISKQKIHYGVDAPGLVKGLFAIAAMALSTTLIATIPPWRSEIWAAVIALLAILCFGYSTSMGCYMVYTSKISKVCHRDALLDLIPWSGKETVLDVGCGRGVLLVAAAKRVPDGRVIGIDIWQAEDKSDNRPETPLINAEIEGVSSQVNVQTADMRSLPFQACSFDVVVSRWTIHNLSTASDRLQAIDEMVRVLKPGGHLLIVDIENQYEYLTQLEALKFQYIQQSSSRLSNLILKILTFDSFQPFTLTGHKPT
ncbi:MAG: class I SAM-dependent methyltransferase [Cyanobacteria bacterium P01_H01_bin.153]